LKPSVFIAGRISSKGKENLSGPAVRISILTIALGLAVMIISLAVLTGFQQGIRDKVTGFAAHIQVDNFDANASYELAPVDSDQPFLPVLESNPAIRHIQVFALKAGIIKTEDEIQGVVLKGVGQDFDWSFFKQNLVDGNVLSIPDSGASTGIIISKYISDRLRLKVGDDARMYFITGEQAQPRGRKFSVNGIYETGLEEFDRSYVICDLRHIQKLNSWDDGQVSGFEIFINDFSKLDETGKWVYSEIGYDLNSQTVKELYPQIFDWLRLMDMNVVIILVLMIMVAGITMVSTLLILVLDRTVMIGILKALGMKNKDVRRIFLLNSAYIIGRGMLWGNIAGLAICFIQEYFRIIPLDQASYYMSSVPVQIQWWAVLAINLGTFLVCMAFLVIPGVVISRITPIKAIRFN
jgi:lipoprotein-releasing system permease protein